MFVKIRKLFIIVMALVLLGIISGCTTLGAISITPLVLVGQIIVSNTEDVTALDRFQDVDLWKSYARNQVYRLKLDLFYGKVFITTFDEDELILPNSNFFEWDSKTNKSVAVVPESVEAYKADPTKWVRIKGITPSGTRLKMERVIYKQDINTHDYYYFAVFVDGPIAGKTILLNSISINKEGYGRERYVNPDFLEKVNAT